MKSKKQLREWKKVFEDDLGYIVFEFKETIKTPAFVILKGELGTGKTTFCKTFADEATLSPTYSVLSETQNMLHADFYRIKDVEEIYHLELELYLEGKSFFFAEWGEKFTNTFSKILPDDWTPYVLEIEVNESEKKGQAPSRNFQLSSFSFF